MDASTRFALEDFLPFRLNRLAAEVSGRLSAVYMERFRLDIPDWRVLATLSGRGAATAQAIVASTRTHKSTISRAVAKLKARGLIERQGSHGDGREIVLSLSEEGRLLMAELVPLVLGEERRLLAALSAMEQSRFLALLGKLEEGLGLEVGEANA